MSELVDFEEQNKILRATIIKRYGKITALRAERKKLNNALYDKTYENDELKQLNSKHVCKIDEIQNQYDDLKNKYDDLKETHDEMERLYSCVQRQRDALSKCSCGVAELKRVTLKHQETAYWYSKKILENSIRAQRYICVCLLFILIVSLRYLYTLFF